MGDVIVFRVDDMSCGHCAGVITRAVRGVDAAARVDVDLARHRVEIEAVAIDAVRLGRAIAEAGYTPVAVDGALPGA